MLTAFNFAAAVEQINVTRRWLRDLQEQYDLTQTLENAGKIVRSETLQAKTQLEDARANLPGLEKQRDVYQNALLRLIGKAPQDDSVPTLALRDSRLPRSFPCRCRANWCRQRPDILEAEDMLHQASAEVGVAEAARFPSFDISAQYAQQSIRTSDLFTKSGQIWSVGLEYHSAHLSGRHPACPGEGGAAAIPAGAGSISRHGVGLPSLKWRTRCRLCNTTPTTTTPAPPRWMPPAHNRDLAREQFQKGRVNELDRADSRAAISERRCWAKYELTCNALPTPPSCSTRWAAAGGTPKTTRAGAGSRDSALDLPDAPYGRQ